jgi:hypothetical protein
VRVSLLSRCAFFACLKMEKSMKLGRPQFKAAQLGGPAWIHESLLLDSAMFGRQRARR